MRTAWRMAALALAGMMLVGCSTYTIRTKDGREYTSDGRPDITSDRYVKFKTTSGQKILLKQDEVSIISED